MKCRAREHEAIDERHRHTHVDTAADRPQHATCRRAVQEQGVPAATIGRRDHDRRAVVDDRGFAVLRRTTHRRRGRQGAAGHKVTVQAAL